MSDIEESNDQTPYNYENLWPLLTTSIPGAVYELSKELLDEKYQEDLINLENKYHAEQAVNERIETWRKAAPNPKRTRVIVKVTNNTSRTLKLTGTNTGISQAERKDLTLFPQAPMAFKCEFDYNFSYGLSSRTLFSQYIDFADHQAGVRFEIGLHVNSSFGVFTPTLKPVRKNKIRAFGSPTITCTTNTIEERDEAPFSFSVEITLS